MFAVEWFGVFVFRRFFTVVGSAGLVLFGLGLPVRAASTVTSSSCAVNGLGVAVSSMVSVNGNSGVVNGSTVRVGDLVTVRWVLNPAVEGSLDVDGFSNVVARLPLPLGVVYEPGSLKIGSPFYGVAVRAATDSSGPEGPDDAVLPPVNATVAGYTGLVLNGAADLQMSAEVAGTDVVFRWGDLDHYDNTNFGGLAADPDEALSLVFEYSVRAQRPGYRVDFVGPEIGLVDNSFGVGGLSCPRDPGVTTSFTIQGNRQPVAVADDDSTLPGVPVSGNVLTNDYDEDNFLNASPSQPQNAGLEVTTVGTFRGSLGGVFVLAADGSFTYTPGSAARQGLTDCVSYTIEDMIDPVTRVHSQYGLQSNTKLCVHITKNQAPVAVEDQGYTAPDTSVTVNVLANDTDPDNVAPTAANTGLVVVSTGTKTGGQGGRFVVGADGSATYTPPAGKSGFTDCVVLTIRDQNAASASIPASAPLCVTVELNRGPVEVDDQGYTAPDTPVTVNVLANDTDPDNVAPVAGNTGLVVMSPGVVTGSAGGSFNVSASGSVTYTPPTGRSGIVDCVSYTVRDRNAAPDSKTASARVCVTVQSNAAPVAVDDVNSTSPDVAVTGNVLVNDSDPDNRPPTVPATGLVVTSIGSFSGSAGGRFVLAADGSYTYTPPAGRNDITSDCVPYTIADSNGTAPRALAASARLCVSVSPNTPPVSVDDVAYVRPGGTVTGNVLTNDSDKDNLAPTAPNTGLVVVTPAGVVKGSGGGTFTFTSNGSWTYTAEPSTSGFTDCVAYTVKDRSGDTSALSSNARLCVTVTANKVPVALNDGGYVPTNGSTTGNVLANDSDPDNTPPASANTGLVVTTTGTFPGSNGGTFTLAADGSYTYVAPTGRSGFTDCVAYAIRDSNSTPGYAVAANATLCISVGTGNTAPVAVDDVGFTEPGSTVTVNVLVNDFDHDNGTGLGSGAGLTMTTIGTRTGSNGGVFVFATNGDVTYTPPPARTGFVDCVNYTIADLGGSTASKQATAKVCVTVGGTNGNGASGPGTAPFGVDDFNYTTPTKTVTGNVLANDGDNSSPNRLDGLRVATTGVLTGSGGGSFLLNADGGYVYTPVSDRSGYTDCVAYRLNEKGRSNGIGLSGTAKLCVSVGTGTNRAPLAQPDQYLGEPSKLVVTGDVRINDTDPDIPIPAAGQVPSSLLVVQYTQPAHGTVALIGPGSFRYRPAPNWIGEDSFDYTITDGAGGTATATVSIVNADQLTQDLRAVTDSYGSTANPVKCCDLYQAASVLRNDTVRLGTRVTQINGNPVGNGTITLPSRAVLTINPDTGKFSYRPASTWNRATDTFTYTISVEGQQSTATVTIKTVVKTAVRTTGTRAKATPVCTVTRTNTRITTTCPR